MKFILPKTSDLRFSFLGKHAAEKGFHLIEYTHTPPAEQGIFLFPFGMTEQELLRALEAVPAGSLVFTGKTTPLLKAAASEKGILATGLLENEIYLLQNAVHTAEGALAEVISHTDRRLDQLCILVYGYGNCGSAIARLFWLCGAEIWVWSRERGQARAHQDGFNVFPAPEKGLGMFDAVINTVPDFVFSPDFLSTMGQDSFFFQIASGLSGIDAQMLQDRGIRFIPLHGLPGKYCPASEADALWDLIESVLSTLQPRSSL